MLFRLGILAVALGGFIVSGSGFAHRWHHRALRTHIERMEDADTGLEAHQEMRRFHGGRKLKVAVWLMVLEPLGYFLVFGGVLLVLGASA